MLVGNISRISPFIHDLDVGSVDGADLLCILFPLLERPQLSPTMCGVLGEVLCQTRNPSKAGAQVKSLWDAV